MEVLKKSKVVVRFVVILAKFDYYDRIYDPLTPDENAR